MATTASETQVQELYIAYFGRPADPTGLAFYADSLDAGTTTVEAIATSFSSSVEAQPIIELDTDAYLEAVYQQAFGRAYNSATDGTFWADAINNGETTKELAMVQILDGAQNNDKIAVDNKVSVATTYTTEVQVESKAYAGAEAAASAKAVLTPVTFEAETVDAGNDSAVAAVAVLVPSTDSVIDPVSDNVEINGSTFTLFDNVNDIVEHTEFVPVLMWGYNPHGHDEELGQDVNDENVNEGSLDGGIPAADLVSFLVDVAGVDFFELGLIDDDGVDPVDAISKIANISLGDIQNDNQSTITITTTDGEVLTAEASLGKDYLNFMSDLLFDAEGNSRLYMSTEEDAPVLPVTPAVLTTVENNGSTIEEGFTTADNDLIVAGRTELLHGAYIDGGAGENVLQIDMKGVYAQPLELLNIQQIQVQNLPNVYSDGINSSVYPDVLEDEDDLISYSVLDLSRAIDLEKLIITEGYGTGEHVGTLTVVGIRNGVTTKLEGGFSDDVSLHYGQGIGSSVNLELNLGDTDDFNLNVAQNSNTLNLDSQGSENWLASAYFGGVLSNLNITGDAALYIQGDLNLAVVDPDEAGNESSFHAGRPATINASANTGGVDLTINNHDDVVFYGSQANDELTATNSTKVFVSALAGNNTITTDESDTVDVNTGAGNDVISSLDSVSVTINAGNGNNTITASAEMISVTTGAGNDTVTLSGLVEVDEAESGEVDHATDVENAAKIMIDLGTGSNLLVLGADDDADLDGVTALQGSTISGENITLEVNEDSDLHEAALSGVSAVNLSGGNLVITAEQFIAIGAANFSVENSAFNATAELTIVVADTMNFDALGIDASTFDNSNINLNIALGTKSDEEVTFTLTAAQLHEYIAVDGIGVNSNSNYDDNQVVITDAGLTFDAMAAGAGSIVSGVDVTVVRTLGGYERPEQDDLVDTWTINSDETPIVDVADVTDIDASQVGTIVVEGASDINFVDSLTVQESFVLDFSALQGTATGITISNFEVISGADLGDPDDDGEIIGNGVAGTRIDVGVDGQVGAPGNVNGLKSSGVSTYVVTMLDGAVDEDFYVCDHTLDLEVLGLQGNFDGTINFLQVNHGVEFLLEGDGTVFHTLKANGDPATSNVGTFNAEFFWDGAPAVVNINNQGTALTTRALHVEGLEIDNADSITINVTDGDAIIKSLAGDSVNDVIVNSANDVTVQGTTDGLADLESFDASGVVGTFTLELNDGVNDLSGVTVTGVDSIHFTDDAALTISVDQALLAAISTDEDVDSTLNLVELAEQAIDLTTIDVDALGTVTFSEVDGTIVVNAATVFGNGVTNVTEAEIVALTSDSTVEMTAAQYDQFTGTGTVTIDTGTNTATGDDFVATLVLTDLAVDADIDLNHVDAEQVIRVSDLTATVDMEITSGDDVVLEVAGGEVDLTLANLDAITTVTVTADSTLTLTAAQLFAIGTDSTDGIADNFSIAAGVVVTLNVVELAGQELDLGAIEAAGFNVGSISVDAAGSVALDVDTTFGGADSVTILTGDNGVEDVVTLTAAQFMQTAGVFTELGEDAAGLMVTAFGNTEATIDVSAVTLTGDTQTVVLDEDVTLDVTANLAGFTINTAGNRISLATEAQANEAIITGAGDVAWLFDVTAAQVDTDAYATTLGTLFVNEELVDGANVEELWNTLANTITVQVVNLSDLPTDVLRAVNRMVVVEAYTGLADGWSFDDQNEFQFVDTLTIELQGNTVTNNLVIDDTVGEGTFTALTIESTEVRPADLDDGITLLANTVGNISLGAGSTNALDDITLDTGFLNDGNPATLGEGIALEVGTITFGSAESTALLTLSGANDITIGGLDISDADITLLTIDNSNIADVVITGINQDDNGDEVVAATTIFVMDGFVGVAEDLSVDASNMIQVVGGDNDLTALVSIDATVDAVLVSADATITMTAAQIATIGEANFSILAGVVVTLNVTELDATALDLDIIQDAGFNIGTVSTVEDDGGLVATVLDAGTTFGGADQLNILMDAEENTITMTAAQYQTISGNIVEVDSDVTNNGAVANAADVTITDLDAIEDATTNDVTIDLSTVLTTGAHNVEVADDNTAADVTLTAASDLSDFTVVLQSSGNGDDNDFSNDQTIRFATAVQAERTVEAEDGSTNVVWLFDTITGTANGTQVDTSNYEDTLGRVWMLDTLVDGANVEELFTSLDQNIIIRVENSDVLTSNELATNGFDRTLEIEGFTTLPLGLTFSDIDNVGEAFDFVQNLTLDLGGNIALGNVTISNLLAAAIFNNDEFNTLTINSIKADSDAHYLLPELTAGQVWGNGAGEIPLPTGTNAIGDIQSGSVDFDLLNVTVATGAAAGTGNEITIGTITFAEDGDDANGDANVAGTTATFTTSGDSDITVASLNTTDVDIANLVIDHAGTGTLTVTGASPAAAVSDTETLTITAGGDITLGTAGDITKPGISSSELSTINVDNGGFNVDLGVIDSVDVVLFALDGDTGDDGIALTTATIGNGTTAINVTAEMTLDSASVTLDGVNFGAASTLTLVDGDYTITNASSFTAGATLDVDGITLNVADSVDLTGVVIVKTGAITIDVAAGETLTLTAEQADGMTITGAGIVNVIGLEADVDNVTLGIQTADLSAIMVGEGDTGTVTATLDSTGDVVLTDNVGITAVAITGTGTVSSTDAMAAVVIDRDPTAVVDNETVLATFTVGTGSTLALTMAQADARVASGAGTVTVAITGDTAADLAGLTATSVTATISGNTVFTGDLGTAVVTVNDGFSLTAAYSLLTGKTINEVAAPAGTGTLTVSIPAADAAADLSTIAGDMDAAQITANFTEAQTFTGDLSGADASVVAGVGLVVSASIVDGATVAGIATSTIEITDLATNLAADLAGITVAGVGATATAAFDADGTFTGDLGTVTVTIADTVTMTASATVLIGADVNKSGAGADDGAVVVTVSNSEANYDSDNADADGDTATGTFEEVDLNLDNIISGSTGTAADITSITVTDSLTFRGTLNADQATLIADGATLSTTAAIVTDSGQDIDAAGTTGAVTVDNSIDAAATVRGSANFTVTGTVDALTATAVTGTLDVTVATDAAMSIALGAGTNTVDAIALADTEILTVTGVDTAATITVENGDVTAVGVTDGDADSTTGGVTLIGGDGTNTLTGSANDDIINGGIDADTLVGGAGDDVYIYDATLDIIAGETINDTAGALDTINVNTVNPLDISLINTGAALTGIEILDLNATVNTDVDVTVTGAQLNALSIVVADGTDLLTIDTINGLTLAATSATDTFVFAAADTGIQIDGLAVADTIDFGLDVVLDFDVAAGVNIGAVLANGDWFFDDANDVLTYWSDGVNPGTGAQESVTITGVATLTAAAQTFDIATLG